MQLFDTQLAIFELLLGLVVAVVVVVAVVIGGVDVVAVVVVQAAGSEGDAQADGVLFEFANFSKFQQAAGVSLLFLFASVRAQETRRGQCSGALAGRLPARGRRRRARRDTHHLQIRTRRKGVSFISLSQPQPPPLHLLLLLLRLVLWKRTKAMHADAKPEKFVSELSNAAGPAESESERTRERMSEQQPAGGNQGESISWPCLWGPRKIARCAAARTCRLRAPPFSSKAHAHCGLCFPPHQLWMAAARKRIRLNSGQPARGETRAAAQLVQLSRFYALCFFTVDLRALVHSLSHARAREAPANY